MSGREISKPIDDVLASSNDPVASETTSTSCQSDTAQVSKSNPAPDPVKIEMGQPQVSTIGADKGTILLVDDEEMVRDLTETMLKLLGFSVLTAKDGIEAVEIFQLHPKRILFVICDLTMPRMNGWNTLKALRAIDPGIGVILVSGYNDVQVMDGNHSEHPQVFLGKPYGLEQFRKAIHAVLNPE